MAVRHWYLGLFGQRRRRSLVGDMVFPRVIQSVSDFDGYYGMLVTTASPESRRLAGP
jgi:hypothetical protein